MTPAEEVIKRQKLADTIRAAMDAQHASLAETVEVLALIAAENADAARIGSENEHSWTVASTRLFDLAQAGRLYRPLSA